jgi:hypothetical protein
LEAHEAAQQAIAAAYRAQAEAQVEQARAAAYQAQAVYEQAQADTQGEQSFDETAYQPAWIIPFYPQFGLRFHGYRPPSRHMIVQSPRHTVPAHHVQSTVVTFRH